MSLSNKKGNIIFAIIIVLIFLVAVFITYLAIDNHNKQIYMNNNYTFKKVSHQKILDVFEKYPVNPITFDKDNYIISGLKDKEIETKINNKIKNIVDSINDENKWCNIDFNVSNVLAISCNSNSLVVDLNTGNDILFEEIFNDTTDLDDVLRSSLYDNSCNWFYNCHNYDDWYDEYYNQIDNFIVETYRKIKGQKISFSLHSSGIMIFDEHNYVTVNFYEYPDEVTIYNRFLTKKDIYENEVTEYCDVYRCNFNLVDGEYWYDKYYYINAKNYITYTLNNITNTNIDFSTPSNDQRDNLDIKMIGENVLQELIDKYELNSVNDNYKMINIYGSVYKTPYDYYQIGYEIKISEYDKLNFQKRLLSFYYAKSISEKEIYQANMILKNNKFEYLEDNPNKVFTDFEDTLYKYIKSSLKDNNDYENPFYIYCCGRMDSLGLEKTDFHKVIKESTYSIDIENKKIYMNNESYVVELPWNIFKTLEEKEIIENNEVDN